MALVDIADWLDEHAKPSVVWYAKRLAANDTLASGGHQAGPYMPKDFLFSVLPSLNRPEAENPESRFELRIDSHADVQKVRAVWYNNKLRDGTRNEARLTNFGGAGSALLDPESTGSLAVFAFHQNNDQDASVCHVWVCDNEIEAEFVEERIGTVEPGKWRIWSVHDEKAGVFPVHSARSSCWLEASEIPHLWREKFPSAVEIILKTIELCPLEGKPADFRLVKRRECEFEIFRSVESFIELTRIKNGFSSIDDFINVAQTILQRRKSRSGRSLELHTRQIFIEEELQEGVHFSHQPESEQGKRPDFLFPSENAYKNPSFSAEKLRMLAVKTTCKDRWRQILNEAGRIKQKHLLTLQEGVSEGQFQEMTEAGVQLVVPQQLKSAYPKSIQQNLQTVESFIGDVRLLSI